MPTGSVSNLTSAFTFQVIFHFFESPHKLRTGEFILLPESSKCQHVRSPQLPKDRVQHLLGESVFAHQFLEAHSIAKVSEWPDGFTLSDESNAIVAHAFRNEP